MANSHIFRVAASASLVLASTSPRRRELLGSLGLPFAVRKPQAEENPPEPGEEPAAYVRRMAQLKGLSAARDGETVIAADTVVSLQGEIFGKPEDESDALAMLLRLNGRTHQVKTGVWIQMPEPCLFHVESAVSFGRFPPDLLERYAKSGEPLDKAGAYAVQGMGAFLISAIAGSHSNVIGLPLEQLTQALLQGGVIH